MQSQKKRSLLKTLTWRILATSDTFLISWLITERFDFAGAIAGIEVITKMFLYYMHERGWDKIKFGRAENEQHTLIFPDFNEVKVEKQEKWMNIKSKESRKTD